MMKDAACCLCPMRGGALKMTSCNKWAHVTCALILPKVMFETFMHRKPIDLSSLQYSYNAEVRDDDRALLFVYKLNLMFLLTDMCTLPD